MREFFILQGGGKMFNLFPKKEGIYAPIAGRCLDITSCKDETFASKMLGDGFMILPSENIVRSPCNGKINSIFPTKHAIGIITKDRKEILLHIGIDTVKLKGTQFESFVSVGEKVKRGAPLVKFNDTYMKENGIDMSTIVILLNGGEYKYSKRHIDDEIKAGEIIIDVESGDLYGINKEDQ